MSKSFIGKASIIIGIVNIVTGIAIGTLSIVFGSFLIKRK
ncbi:hypothetical protein EDC19_2298 [Natranaerovirga hydrolytica]|uniref:Uncharacterized protein n=1 Tax=Natranaerovirga hydrolytica TaxID=680378 RepID=A0A4R1MJP0_9FIRM|nr:hypothetical protein EDC19_2298 [Natranaerovirga hydrolytica]